MTAVVGVDPGRVGAAIGELVGIDVGGTSIKGLLSAQDGTVRREIRVATPAPDPSGLRVCAAVAQVAADLGHRPGTPLGVAVPGVVDERLGLARSTVNLGWADLPVRDLLSQACGSEVVLSHDVRAGAYAEARTGAAAGRGGVLAFVAVGTGIAAGLLVDGRPLTGDGWAGEIGQLVLTEGPFAGRRTEEVASAAATARRAGLPHARAVAAAVAAGDPGARRVWDETVEVLARSLAGLTVAVGPAAIVLGGGLALAGDLLVEPLRGRTAQLLPGLRLPELLPAVHGDRAAALGAAFLAGGPRTGRPRG